MPAAISSSCSKLRLQPHQCSIPQPPQLPPLLLLLAAPMLAWPATQAKQGLALLQGLTSAAVLALPWDC